MYRSRTGPAFPITAFALAACLLATACRDASEGNSGPQAGLPAAADPEDDSDQPIRFAYVCGNRFVVRSTYSVPVTVTWRVNGTSEEGSATLAAAPADDPAFSEYLIDTRSGGEVELSFQGRRVRARANGGVPCTPSASTAALAGAAAAQTGSWSAPFSWAGVAVHLHLLPNGKVLSWGGPTRIPQVWDPATRTFTPYPSPIPLFCTGHAFTPDGRLAVFGGHIKMEHGLPNITLFNKSGGWANSTPMRRGRWYPTVVTMAGGEIVAISGKDQNGVIVPVPEVWKNGVVRELTTAPLTLPYYPIAFMEPRGKLFYAGEQQMSRFLDITGTGKWIDVGLRRFGVRDYGSAVMYDAGKILYAGGGRTTATAEIIDLNKAAPRWEWTGSMAYPRRHLNTTVLPTGEVLVTSGTAGTVFNDLTKIVQAAEMWSPATGVWTTMASAGIPRGYHSTALLLRDARVLVSGGGDGADAAIQQNAELFSPPYLFRGARPRISSAPAVVRYGEAFRVLTPDAASIARVSLIRIGSVTHGVDTHQRFQRVGFSADETGLTVAAVTNRRRTPPGHYMLFILNGADVPSVAKIVQIK